MLLIYLFQARNSGAGGQDSEPDRFFLSAHEHSTEEYGATQTAYFLQMATVYPFFVFGFTGIWWLGFWNTLFYAVGIYLFIAVLPRCHSGILDLVGRSSTPHALVSAAHQMPVLRVIASWLSILGFVGLAVFETIWGTVALRSVLGGSSFVYYISICVFALYLVTVLWSGGQGAAIKNAQWQLVISYIGLHLLTGWTLSLSSAGTISVDAPVIFPFIFLFGSVAALRRLLSYRQDGSKLLMTLNGLAVLSLLYVLYTIASAPGFFTMKSLSYKDISLPPLGGWMLFTMACMPLFFQFVDMSNWQRLSSLAGSGDKQLKNANEGLKFFLLESPLSWLFPIAMGMCAAAAATFFEIPKEGDPWTFYMERVTGLPGLLGGAIAIAAVTGVLSVFLSTADALLTASGYAFAYDIVPSTRGVMDKIHFLKDGSTVSAADRQRVVYVGKVATTAAIAVAIAMYIIVDVYSASLSGKLLGFFLSLFTPMLSFAPSMLIPVLTRRATNRWFAFFSIVVSAAAGIGIGAFSLVSADEVWQWAGVPACFCVSWGIYLFGFAITRRTIDTTEQEA